MNLSTNVKVTQCLGAVVAGTTVQHGTTLDMQGFDGVMFIGAVGVLTATAVTALLAQGGAASDGSDKAAIAGATVSFADSDDDKAAVVDVYRPLDRYVTPTLSRGTANAVIQGVFAIQYSASKKPTAADAATIVGSALVAGGA